MQKAATFGEALTKRFRGGTDSLRGTFELARRLRHPGRFLAAQRAARAVRKDPKLRIDPAQGFRLFEPGRFAEATEAVQVAQGLLAEALDESGGARRHGKGRKRFLVNLLDPSELGAAHPLVRLALRPDLLSSIVDYMGTIPVLRSIQVFYSGALESDPTGSQLYHCDADDRRQVKIFVLCSDVRSANGPLTVLDAERSARVRRATKYRYHSRLTDEQVQAIVGTAPPAEVVGEPGTLCLVDTSRCFHYGSRVSPGAAPRLVAMVQYLNPVAFVLPGNYRSGAQISDMPLDGLSPLQRAVVSGDYAHLKARAEERL